MQMKAVEILRDRNHPSKSIYTAEEIQWAVEIMREWEPDHPLLRYSERGKSVSKHNQ